MSLRCNDRGRVFFQNAEAVRAKPYPFRPKGNSKTQPQYEDWQIEFTNNINGLARPQPGQLAIIHSAKVRADMTLRRTMQKLHLKEPDALRRLHLLFGNQVGAEAIHAGLRLIAQRLDLIDRQNQYLVDPNASPTNLAYVIPPVSVSIDGGLPWIHLSPNFFGLTHRAQASVLVHEAAHFALGVDDLELTNGKTAYGLLNAIQLANEQTAAAINNADNWSSFVDGYIPDMVWG
jgi:hypothetical protein